MMEPANESENKCEVINKGDDKCEPVNKKGANKKDVNMEGVNKKDVNKGGVNKESVNQKAEGVNKKEVNKEGASKKEVNKEGVNKKDVNNTTSKVDDMKSKKSDPPQGAKFEPPTEPKSPPQPPKKVSERISLLRRSNTSANLQATSAPPPPIAMPTSNSKWLEAYSKAKALKTVQESQIAAEEKGKMAGNLDGIEEEDDESKFRSGVKERALLFGNVSKTKNIRRPLRRSQSSCDIKLRQARANMLLREN